MHFIFTGICKSVITVSTIEWLVAHLWSCQYMHTKYKYICIYVYHYIYNSHMAGSSALPKKVDGPASVVGIHIHIGSDL